MESDKLEFSYIITTNHTRNTHPQVQLFESLCQISQKLDVVQFFPSKSLKDEYCLKTPSNLEEDLLSALSTLNISYSKSAPTTNKSELYPFR